MTPLDQQVTSDEGEHDAVDHWIRQATGSWCSAYHKETFELADPEGRASGELKRFGGHWSLSLDGLSPSQVERVMQVLRTGY